MMRKLKFCHRLRCGGFVWIVCQLLFLAEPILLAQKLQLSSVSARRGDQVTIELSLESRAGSEPLALQWDAKFPAAQMTLVDDKVLIGSTARDAGKSLNCAVRDRTAASYTCRCILAGAQKPIPAGVIATFRLTIDRKAKIGSTSVRVEQGIAVSKDLKQVLLEPVETSVAIHK